ncbi:hypothetical protein [Paenibacillus terreus]|uniref:hypothetical protein n=1 Tax=Paenibacillus terreus TaxID=1387834 RepID=UPI0035CD055F
MKGKVGQLQYALMELNGTKIIIDAVEVNSLHKFGNGARLQDIEPEDHTLSLKVVYGQFIPQPEMALDKVKEDIIDSKGMALGYIYQDACRILVLEDISLETPLANGYIPFAALLSTDLEVEPTSDQAISAFLRYGDMIPEDNILNRFGIFSITRVELNTKDLTVENWKVFVDLSKIPSEVQTCHHEQTPSRTDLLVEELKHAETIKDKEQHTFVLTHTYDQETRLFFFRGPYAEETMNALIAYIQHKGSEIDMAYGMDQTEVITVLKKFYDCSDTDLSMGATEIDLYINWEQWAGADLLNVAPFEREGLDEFLKTLIEN